MSPSWAVTNTIVDGQPSHVLWSEGVVTAVVPTATSIRRWSADQMVDADGGELIPGLHDHHVHLTALAAARCSVLVGPCEARSARDLVHRLESAASDRPDWIRAIGYHESVAGELDADVIDRLLPGLDRCVRIQHRSGQLWILNRAALKAARIAELDHPGVERDGTGQPTGRLYGLDRLLRDRVPREYPDIAGAARELAAYGITGVTDATPVHEEDELTLLSNACTAGLAIDVTITGGPDLPPDAAPYLRRGPVKLLHPDHETVDLDLLTDEIEDVHRRGRAVAIHCVTRAGLVVALAAFQSAGSVPGDRIEHGAVIPLELLGDIRALGLIVITQPNLVAERGDQYLAEVDPDDLADLWRCRSLLAAGIDVAFGTDHPFGNPDPWRAILAASRRVTPSGRVVGSSEQICRWCALQRFLGSADSPHRPRRVRTGERTDLCLLTGPLSTALDHPSPSNVRATFFHRPAM